MTKGFTKLSYFVFAAVVMPVACDGPQPTEPPNRADISFSEQDVPPRSQDYGSEWLSMSDDDLWRVLEERGGLAMIGLKRPGATRGRLDEPHIRFAE